MISNQYLITDTILCMCKDIGHVHHKRT